MQKNDERKVSAYPLNRKEKRKILKNPQSYDENTIRMCLIKLSKDENEIMKKTIPKQDLTHPIKSYVVNRLNYLKRIVELSEKNKDMQKAYIKMKKAKDEKLSVNRMNTFSRNAKTFEADEIRIKKLLRDFDSKNKKVEEKVV